MDRRSLPPRPAAPALALSAAGLVGACVLSACGTGEPVAAAGAPRDAAVADFCAAYQASAPATRGGVAVAALHEAAGELADVGTPPDIPEQAREGYVVYVASTSTLTDGQAEEATEAADADEWREALELSEDDAASVTAFRRYATGTCFSA